MGGWGRSPDGAKPNAVLDPEQTSDGQLACSQICFAEVYTRTKLEVRFCMRSRPTARQPQELNRSTNRGEFGLARAIDE